MAENENIEERDDEFEASKQEEALDNVIHVSGMFKEWFLDYASYVILERAVPHLNDGLKPVQRRILHSLKELDDGRFHKVANVIGNTMKYHPHGDASIGDALVQLGQKELLFDMQGNWGNIYTGDSAAAPRYIEVRLSKFALEVGFNHKTTEWLASYDGRGKEPVTLPMKFPLLLAQGVEGIAVGLACKILPHNFNELIDGSIAILKGKKVVLYPDFPTGGMVDVSNYNDGLRGGRLRVRARIKAEDNKTLKITEIPFGTNTSSLIDSILKANEKGKIKVKKIEDNTAEFVEILIHLTPGVSPDKTIDALYAFTDCELSISPNSCVIEDDRPKFLGVAEMLQHSTQRTMDLLKWELEIKKSELEESWHFASLEKIFIEKRIYRDIEECETWEEILSAIRKGLEPYIKHLIRAVTDDDITRLTDIRIKRISKFDSYKADEHILKLEDEIEQVKHSLSTLVEYTIDYFKRLKDKYSKGRERKTEIRSFDTIEAVKVAVANEKLYVQREDGFVGYGLKKTESEYLEMCSDIDDVVVIRRDGKMMISKVSEKAFFGKDILYAGVWKKGDDRTIFNIIYQDGPKGFAYVKRFAITSITRDKEYDLAQGRKDSKILYMSVNPNGEAEVISVILRAKAKLRKLKFDLDFSDVAIKGRSAKGNIISKNLILKIVQKEKGISTLGALKVWFDETVHRLNTDERGTYLGAFKGEDKILVITHEGYYRLASFEVTNHFEEDIIVIEKYNPQKVISCIYFDGEKQQYNVKRFIPEETDRKVSLLTEHKDSHLEYATTDTYPVVKLQFDKRSNEREDEVIELHDFIGVKGVSAKGNRLTQYKIKSIDILDPKPEPEIDTTEAEAEEEIDINNTVDDADTEEDDVIEIPKPNFDKSNDNNAPGQITLDF